MTIIKNTKQLLIITALFLFTVSFASANTIVRSGESISIAEGNIVEGDLYAAAGTINISGVIDEDAVIMGGQVTLNGNINRNAFLLAGSVDIHGAVGDDLRIVSGEVVVAESVAGDLFVVGGSVKILSSASIAGDVLVYAGDVVVEGLVGGDILGVVGDLRVDSEVGGDIDVTVNNLVLGDKSNVQGSISYASEKTLERSLNSTVVGEIIRNDPVIPQDNSHRFASLVPSLILLFSALAWYLTSRKSFDLVVNRTLVKSPRPLLIGLVTVVFLPIATGLLLVSFIGSFVGWILLFGFILFLSLSIVASVGVIGQFLMMAFNRLSKELTLFSLIVGIFGFIILSMLPVLGHAIVLVVVIAVLGTIVDSLIKARLE